MNKLDDIQFLDLPPQFISYKESKYVIQQLPYEYTSSYKKGSSLGPKAILQASHYVELYDEETKLESYKQGISTLKAINFAHHVDEEALALIEDSTSRLLSDDKFVISLAAEHTSTYPIIRSFKNTGKSLTVLQIDAHADLRDTYYDPKNQLSKYSHACVMHRIYDINVPIVQVGVRAFSKEEDDLIKSSENISTFYGYQLDSNNHDWVQKLIKQLKTEYVYITIDADGLDPSIAPAVGTPEPGGLSFQQVTKLLKEVAKNKSIIGFDVLECAPMNGSTITEYTLAKIIYRLINYIEKYNNE